MTRDFRAKNIGIPPDFNLPRRDFFRSSAEGKEVIRKFEIERAERLSGRVRRPILGVKISEDFGKTWKLRALCDECVSGIEPPMQRRKLGSAGAQTCDWCGALNNAG